MSMVFPARTISIDFNDDGVPETDITSRVVTSLLFDSGIFGSSGFERTAGIGSLSFSIDNSDNAYIDASILVGKAVNIILTYGYISKQVWYGHIKKANIDDGDWGDKRVHIQAVDWMGVANGKVIQGVQLQTTLTIDEAIPYLFAETAVDPAYTDFDDGFETFPAVFDGVKKKITVYGELDKLTTSELGWTYLKYRPYQDGVTLRVENYLSRGATKPISTIPVGLATPSVLKFHGLNGETGYLKWHDASDSGRIKIHERQDAAFNATLRDGDWSAGNNVVNDVSVRIYPRLFDDTSIILYSLDEPIYIGTTQKIIMHARFVDPDTDQEIPGFNVITPVATTDYLFNSLRAGTGTNYTANLVTFFGYSAGGFDFTAFNKGNPGWLTFFRVRGYGIHKKKPIEYQNINTQSEESLVRETVARTLVREYSNSYDTSKTFADSEIALNRYPSRMLHSASFIANSSEVMLSAYMNLEQGDKIRMVTRSPNHTGSYYIQGIKTEIDLGGVIDFTWYLQEGVETFCEPIAVYAPTGTVSGAIAAIDYGILPYLSNMQQFSYSAWVKKLATGSGYIVIMGRTVDTGSGRRGNGFWIDVDHKIYFYSFKTPTDGLWQSNNQIFTSFDGQWHHVVVTYDNTNDQSDPKIYVDGVEISIFESITPTGTSDDDSDIPTILFNTAPDPAVPANIYKNRVYGYGLKDVRIYKNKILSPTEVLNLYQNPNMYNNVQDGLAFQSIYAPRDNRNAYINAAVTDQDLVLDVVHSAAGVPYNEFTAIGAVLTGRELT